MKLTQKELLVLGGFYDTETYRIFRKHFQEDRQMEIAQAATFYRQMDQVVEARGKILELRHIEQELKKLHKLSKGTKNG